MRILVLLLGMISGLASAQVQSKGPRLRIVASQSDGSYILDITERDRVIVGRIYDYKGGLYGGSFRVGSHLNIVGSVFYNRKLRVISVDHRQEYPFFQLRVGRYILEPGIHQTAEVLYLKRADRSYWVNVVSQPVAGGIGIRRDGRRTRISADVSVGPSVLFGSVTMKTSSIVAPRVNLRLTINF